MMISRTRILGVAVMAAAVVLSPAAAPSVLPGATAAAADKVVTYTVSTRGSVQANVNRFADVAAATLADHRGWNMSGSIEFRRVSSGSSFDLILASPSVIANASPGCSAQWSCRVGRSVYINDERWRLATSSWPHSLAEYQRYVILHEVGHWLGLGHYDCQTRGRTAYVMQQQSISLQGCRANVWPTIPEKRRAASLQGVPVHWSSIEYKYIRLGEEGSVLGYPTGWERPAATRGGAYQRFQRGEILWSSSTGSHEVHGAIYRHFLRLGSVRSVLGYPVTDERGTPDGRGRYNHFEGAGGGSIYWTPQTGAHEVYGAIRNRWRALAWERGPLGYPVTGERGTPDGRGRYNHFEGAGGGSIYWTPQTGAHEVYGAIRDRWQASGWERGPLGYPVSGEYAYEGGRRSDFEKGYITYVRGRGTELVVTG